MNLLWRSDNCFESKTESHSNRKPHSKLRDSSYFRSENNIYTFDASKSGDRDNMEGKAGDKGSLSSPQKRIAAHENLITAISHHELLIGSAVKSDLEQVSVAPVQRRLLSRNRVKKVIQKSSLSCPNSPSKNKPSKDIVMGREEVILLAKRQLKEIDWLNRRQQRELNDLRITLEEVSSLLGGSSPFDRL
ncbi:unnamed protein product [Protopolystoma xenopodis]|uniref:Uncharacterized protein n=1 Tax=Protopolystoma xenopodis TaxID=117903 RepID=A0A448WP99_9PLAT|nr:unnamed protein product [Protopolystoma xenopodis]